jgi:hypothetical protein
MQIYSVAEISTENWRVSTVAKYRKLEGEHCGPKQLKLFIQTWVQKWLNNEPQPLKGVPATARLELWLQK